jgi:PAS domain S-box-containing protein
MKLIRSKNRNKDIDTDTDTDKVPVGLKKKIKTAPAIHNLSESMQSKNPLVDLNSNNWKVLLVDDEPDVHEITRIGLRRFTFDGKGLELISAYSAEQARGILQKDQHFAAALIDVVMETEEAGLDLVRFIREEIRLSHIRLIIRTGQPGKAPERFVIDNFDIDDYKEKTDLTTLKMHTMFRTSIKSYRDILTIEKNRVELEQKVLERTLALDSERQRLTDILYGTDAGTWEWDIKTGKTIFNERFANIIGYTLHELEPTTIETWIDFTHPDDLKVSNELLEKHFKRELDYYECEHRMKHKNGSWVWVLARGKVISWTEDNKPLTVSGTHQDITERKHTEDALIEARDSAHQANLAKSIFLSSMSHELRTPLNSILGFGQILEMDKTLNPNQASYIQKIISGGKLLLTLVSEVLDLALIESGKTVLLLEPVDCSKVMNECLDLISPLAEENGIHLNLNSFSPLMRVLADQNRLKQIFINLLSNAVKYNSNEGTVTISAVIHEKAVRIMKTDTGPGIPSDKLKELFIPFKRLGKEAGTIPGTGIGLAFSKRLAKQMKGDIGLESTGTDGSCFCVELPLIEDNDLLSEEKNDDHQNRPAEKLITRVKALVVDDVEMNREILGEFLSLFNCSFILADSGQEGLRAISEQKFDIIFMDVKMPGMDGIETTRRIREMSLHHIPIIAVTAFAMKGDQEKFLKAGMDDYISKPIGVKEVQKILKKYTQ